MYCVKCGTELNDGEQVCPNCGAAQNNDDVSPQARVTSYVDDNGQITLISPKSWVAALILEIFLGALGIHRFYVGKIGTGILWLLTGGLLGIGWLVDLIMIACGRFKDRQGRFLKTEGWKTNHRVGLKTD